ncbi:MAG: hypothetical protein HFH61_03770 [Lachnospiraceae bacterium]|nr:hypothetical protein [Lachnospiraceae bacterium]
MDAPKLRTVNKVAAPFPLNRFPSKFADVFAREIVYMMATKHAMSIEGSEWEQIFAACVGADWKPSNVGLDDVVLSSCCWGAKTVFASAKDILKQKNVRLVCGRNSPTFSFGIDKITSENPDVIGRMVLNIWNERVSAVRQIFKFVRTVVLIKAKDYSEYLIFEQDTVRYDYERYSFRWNKNNNLEGYDRETDVHKFTWQPSGSQFTIIERIPEERVHIKVKKPASIDKETLLSMIHFDNSWYTIVKNSS